MIDLSYVRYSQVPPTNRSCGLRATLDVVAGKWKPLILWHLLSGPVRFGALRRAVAPVSEKVLAQQLTKLEADGIIARTLISEEPLAVEYALTPLGQSLTPILAAMSAWGFENIIGSEAPD